MIYEKKGNFILQKSGINDSFDVYIYDRMNFKGLYGIALVSLQHVSKWCYLRKVLTNYAMLSIVSICILLKYFYNFL